MGKAYKKVVKFLNDYNVDESKALKTLKIYSRKQTSHMVRVASWSAICYDTLQYLKLLEKNKNKTERTIIYNYVNSRDYLNTASYMGRNINITQEKRARNFADMVRKEKRKKYPGVMRFKLKK
jgi:hypothetical protein